MENTKAILNGLIAVASVIEAQLKDGFQASDIAEAVAKLSSDADVKKAIDIAFHNASGLGAEFTKLDVMALVGLALEVVPKVQKLIADATAKPAA